MSASDVNAAWEAWAWANFLEELDRAGWVLVRKPDLDPTRGLSAARKSELMDSLRKKEQ